MAQGGKSRAIFIFWNGVQHSKCQEGALAARIPVDTECEALSIGVRRAQPKGKHPHQKTLTRPKRLEADVVDCESSTTQRSHSNPSPMGVTVTGPAASAQSMLPENCGV